MAKITTDDTALAPPGVSDMGQADFVLDESAAQTAPGADIKDPLSLPANWTPHRPERPEKSEGGRKFQVVSEYEPTGDQPAAIRELVESAGSERDQVLLGVTGSGKTFTMAKVIEKLQRPALVLAPNKTLAAQLYGEFKSFFPHNSVEYFVSYYDYYQPEAYVPRTDTYIEKESSINEAIDRMRHAATRAILERDDVIIVASVSCIYGIGSVETYTSMVFDLKAGEEKDPREVMRNLVALQYQRNEAAFTRGTFRVRGDTLEIFPAHYDEYAWRVSFFGDEIESLTEFEVLTGKPVSELEKVRVYANSHYVTPRPTLNQAIKAIKTELSQRLAWMEANGKLLEAQRLAQRTEFDLEMLEATGSCNGVENYSRYLTGRKPGEPAPTMFEYLPDNALVFVDESHVTIPQLGAMFKGDFNRKRTLAEHGFRLPSCMDNRPLKFEEWEAMRPNTIHVSATPGPWELNQTGGVFTEQVIRPTGLVDPPVEVRPVQSEQFSQVDDIIEEARKTAEKGFRTLVTTLTKRMAEDLTEYMHEQGLKVRYMHSDVDTVERIELIRDLRLGHTTCWWASTCCAKASTSPSAGLWAFSTPTRKASCAAKPAWSRPSAAPPATPRPRSSSTPTASPAPCSAPWTRPTAAARNRPPTISNTASPRARSCAASQTCSKASWKKPPRAAAASAARNAPPASRKARRGSSPTISRPRSRIWRSACAKRRRIWSLRRRRG